MKKFIQKAIYKRIQSAITEYYCDACGEQLTRTNPKQVYVEQGISQHVCKYSKKCNPFYKTDLKPGRKRS